MSASLVAAACEATRPTLASLAVVLVERLSACLERGECERAQLGSLRALAWGGASLPAHVPASLAAHSVRLLATYGQTETAGYVLGGAVGDVRSPMRLQPTAAPEVCAELEMSEGASIAAEATFKAASEGELVLRGCGSAVRSVQSDGGAGGQAASDLAVYCSDPHRTGDIFAFVGAPVRRPHHLGQSQPISTDLEPPHLEHRCRVDDVLAHTSGEMTNPIPLEAHLLSSVASTVSCACVLGDGLSRPVAVVETHVHVDTADEAVAAAVAAAVRAANASVAPYSRMLPAQLLLVAPGDGHPPLPRTAKGTAKRREVSLLVSGGTPPSACS